MITIFTGDNFEESRKQFISLRQSYQSKGYFIIELTKETLQEIDKWLYDSQTLFATQKVFFAENILSKKQDRQYVQSLESSQSVDLVCWESETDERIVKFFFKKARVLVSKLPVSIFKFLDDVFPGNKLNALLSLHELVKSVDENIILFMLERRARELLLIKYGSTPSSSLASWQLGKLKAQSSHWKLERLISFYDALYRVEYKAKKGQTPYSLREALDIVVMFYL